MNYHTKYFNKLEKAVAFSEVAMYQVKEVHFSVRNDAVGQREGKFEVSVDQESWDEARKIAKEV